MPDVPTPASIIAFLLGPRHDPLPSLPAPEAVRRSDTVSPDTSAPVADTGLAADETRA